MENSTVPKKLVAENLSVATNEAALKN